MAEIVRDPHATLGLTPDATIEEIQRAYRRLAAETHPDVNPDLDAADRFRTIKEAHDALVGPRQRKPRRKRNPPGLGGVYPRGPIWWVKFTHAGKEYRDSARMTSKEQAIKLLNRARAAIQNGSATSIAQVRDNVRPTSGVCLADLREAVIEDAKRNASRSLKRKEQAYASLTRHLGEFLAVEAIDKAAVNDYVKARLRDPIGSARRRDKKGNLISKRTVSGPTINRELDQLKLGFRLLDRTPPRFKRLAESDPRDRWPKPGELDRVIQHLPEHLKAPMTLLRITGWRVREALNLEWRRVDMEAGTIRLERRDTKTKKPRHYPFREYPELAALIEQRRDVTEGWQREHGQVVRHVFWQAKTDEKGRPIARPITLWSKAWKGACKKAKVADLTPHDMRRGAARDLIRAGVDEAVAQKLLGHSTASIFRRYNITEDTDLRNAVRKHATAALEPASQPETKQA